MAEMVASAFVQEGVSRAVSFFLDKREEKSPEVHSIERLEMAVLELEFVLERSAKLPIIDISLLRRRKLVKGAYIKGTDLLNKHMRRALPDQEAILQGATHSRSHGRITQAANNLSISSLVGLKKEDCLSLSDVRRFEWYAESARNFLRDVESGCSLRHYMFCNPLVRYLLEGKTLSLEIVQGTQVQNFYLSPIFSEERGMEAELRYISKDCKVPEKNFRTVLLLQLSESTDIVGIATKCLLLLTSHQFKLAAQFAIGGLTLLANLHDTSHWYVPHCTNPDLLSTDLLAKFRQDPFCCKANGDRPTANSVITPRNLLPEQVNIFGFDGCISALEYTSSRRVKRSITRDWRPPLEVSVCFWPHSESRMVTEFFFLPSLAVEIAGGIKQINVSIQEAAEMAGSQAINCFLRQPELTAYKIKWLSVHGSACFEVIKPTNQVAGAPETSGRHNTRSSSKRRR